MIEIDYWPVKDKDMLQKMMKHLTTNISITNIQRALLLITLNLVLVMRNQMKGLLLVLDATALTVIPIR